MSATCLDQRDGTHRVVAIDLAGNVSEPSDPVEVDFSCTATTDPRDGGASLPDPSITDASTSDASSGGDPRPAGGCGCIAGDGGRAPLGALLAFALSLVLARRRLF